MFYPDTSEELLKDLWNRKKLRFVERYKELKEGLTPMSSLLQKLKIRDLALTDITTLPEVDEETRKAILKFCKDRYEHLKSSPIKIASLLFNSFFQMDVIYWKKYEAKKSKNGNWKVSTTYRQLIEQLTDRVKWALKNFEDVESNTVTDSCEADEK